MSEYPVLRAGLLSMLKAPGLKVVGEAASARQALDLLVRRRPDLLLVACHGEECDLVRLAKERRPQLAVLLLGMSDRLTVSRAVALGCSGYLQRTVSRAELRGQAGGGGAPPAEALTASERDVLRLMTEGRTQAIDSRTPDIAGRKAA